MLESRVVKLVKKACLELNILPYFVQPIAGSSGVPDALLKLPLGSTIHLELKADSELRDAQIVFLEKSNNAWKAKYNKKTKQVDVFVDSESIVELSLFLAMEIDEEELRAMYRDFYYKTKAENRERQIYLAKVGAKFESEEEEDYEEE